MSEEHQKILDEIAEKNEILRPLTEMAADLEKKMEIYISLPQIVVNPKNPSKQKTTSAAKLYKETLQQYTNVIKILVKAMDEKENEEESPLRKSLKELLGKYGKK